MRVIELILENFPENEKFKPVYDEINKKIPEIKDRYACQQYAAIIGKTRRLSYMLCHYKCEHKITGYVLTKCNELNKRCRSRECKENFSNQTRKLELMLDAYEREIKRIEAQLKILKHKIPDYEKGGIFGKMHVNEGIFYNINKKLDEAKEESNEIANNCLKEKPQQKNKKGLEIHKYKCIIRSLKHLRSKYVEIRRHVASFQDLFTMNKFIKSIDAQIEKYKESIRQLGGTIE